MKHYAEYHRPGSFVSETTTRELDAHDPQEALAKVPGEGSWYFCFTLFDLPEVDFAYDEERFTVTPKRLNESGRYYIDGELLTIEQVEEMNRGSGGRYDILLSNMRGNGWDPVIRTRAGNVQPFEDGDTILQTS